MATDTLGGNTIFDGSTVLVTGGAGSVGRALVGRLVEESADTIRIFDNNEPNLAAMQAEFGNDRFRYLAGDIRDKSRLERAMQDVDIVIHTAAMKHVDISEYNPFEAVKTNVVGLQNVVDTAIDSGVNRVVYSSSDKAVNPANTMGTTKLLGEKLITAGNKYSGRRDFLLTSVRFGNVLGSSGSVVPLFEDQIEDGGPVTVTDDRMTRFFLTESEMTDLLVSATHLTNGGEVFVQKMTAIGIKDLAETMIQELAPVYGHDPASVEIERIGRRVGETLHEKIMTKWEAKRAVENDDFYAIAPDAEADRYLSDDRIDGFEPADDLVRTSIDADILDRSEIIPFLRDAGVLGADL